MRAPKDYKKQKQAKPKKVKQKDLGCSEIPAPIDLSECSPLMRRNITFFEFAQKVLKEKDLLVK